MNTLDREERYVAKILTQKNQTWEYRGKSKQEIKIMEKIERKVRKDKQRIDDSSPLNAEKVAFDLDP